MNCAGGLLQDQRGLIITTSDYTRDAREEAAADGKTPISIVNGEKLIELLIEHQVGVRRKEVALFELNLDDLVFEEEEDSAVGNKFASLWPLPGGQNKFFETLLDFLGEIGAHQPTLDQMTAWVLDKYEKVTKQGLVKSYLRSVLYPLGLLEFEGERLLLTQDGEKLRSSKDRSQLLELLRSRILGIDEILEFITLNGPATLSQIRAHLVDSDLVSWETDHQPKFRLQWLMACGKIKKDGTKWALQSE